MGSSFDHLIDENADDLIRNADEEEEQMRSNFIEYLRSEKMNNRTLDFKRVYEELEPLTFSHALIVLNKNQIVSKLLDFLNPQRKQKSGSTTDAAESVLSGNVMELFIALIKDLRSELYEEFALKILPGVIEVIDVQNLDLLDKIFTLFSYSFKYLLK